MIPAKRLAEIREWSKKHFNGYLPSPQEDELLELVTAYEAAREYVRLSNMEDANISELGAAIETLECLFPEPTK